MKDKKIILSSLISSIGVFIYILLVSLFFNNAQKIFGPVDTIVIPIVMLLLLVFSVALVGLLIFGYPIWLYFEDRKKDSIKNLFYTIGFLFLILSITLSLVIILK